MIWSIFMFSRNVDISNTPNSAAEEVDKWEEAEELWGGGGGLGTDRNLRRWAADQHPPLLEEENDLEKHTNKTMWSCTLDFQNNFGLSKIGVLEKKIGEKIGILGRGLGTDRDLGWWAADQHPSLLEEENDLDKPPCILLQVLFCWLARQYYMWSCAR